MSLPLVETKLFLPSLRPGLVPRPRLLERLDRGLGAKLMLVSAPAGFGKSTLLVEWLTAAESRAGATVRGAWLALDAADNDPARFWRYVVAATGVSPIRSSSRPRHGPLTAIATVATAASSPAAAYVPPNVVTTWTVSRTPAENTGIRTSVPRSRADLRPGAARTTR